MKKPAESLKQQFPRDDYYGLAELAERGWSKTLIERLLGEPDVTTTNPHYRAGAPMRFYLKEHVHLIEEQPEWPLIQQQTTRHKASASKAVATKIAGLRTDLSLDSLRLYTNAPLESVIKQARNHYNQHQIAMLSDYQAQAGDSVEFTHRITVNYLCHCQTRYEATLDRAFGRVGRHAVAREVRNHILDLIATQYPELANECERQKS